MSNKRKRSRVVSSTLDTPSTSPSTDTHTTTCTNNNSRRLRAAHTVTLRTSNRSHQRRSTQLSSHTGVLYSEPIVETTTLLDGLDGDDATDDATDDVDGNWVDVVAEDEPADGPKRPPVRVNFMLNTRKS